MYCYCKELKLVSERIKVYMAKTTYNLVKSDVKLVCDWLKKLKIFDGYGSNIGNCVNTSECTITRLMSHNCHVLMQRVISIASRELIPLGLWYALTGMFNFFKEIFASTIVVDHIVQLEEDIPMILCKLEKNFPPSLFDLMEHLPIHLPGETILCGPSQFR